MRRGLTLIELTAALFIFVIFIGGVYTAYNTAARGMKQAQDQGELYQTGRVLLAQMSDELACAFQPPTDAASTLTGQDTAAAGDTLQADKLAFLTTKQGLDGDDTASDVRRVTYSMNDEAADEEPGLYLEENRHPGLEMESEQPERRLISPLVVGVNYKYLPNGADWETHWENQTTLPLAVRIEMTLKGKEANAKPIVLFTTVNLAMATAPEAGDAE